MIAQHFNFQRFTEPRDEDPLWDIGGLAFGDRAGGLRPEPRAASQPSGRSSHGPSCDYCGALSCACEDYLTFSIGERA